MELSLQSMRLTNKVMLIEMVLVLTVMILELTDSSYVLRWFIELILIFPHDKGPSRQMRCGDKIAGCNVLGTHCYSQVWLALCLAVISAQEIVFHLKCAGVASPNQWPARQEEAVRIKMKMEADLIGCLMTTIDGFSVDAV